mmetsp:Transcript_53085/g.97001  ORF Transcript_53085/g.97001 Transcript_53085/m.97001 type:complete len:294 (+) Transcript_53085:47-928(+)
MGSALSGDPHRSLKADFKKFDLDGDNQISLDELNTVMRSLDENWSEEQSLRIFKAIDTDKSGTLSLEELIDWVFVENKEKDSSVSWTDYEKYQKFPRNFAQLLWRLAYVAGHWGLAMMNDQRGVEKYQAESWAQTLAKENVLSLNACLQFKRMVLANAMVALPEVFDLPQDHPLSMQHDERQREANEIAAQAPYEISEELWKLVQEMCWAGVRVAMYGQKCRRKSTNYHEQDRLSKHTRIFGQAAIAMSKEPVTVAKFTDMLMEWQLGDTIKRSAGGNRRTPQSRSRDPAYVR